MKHTMHSLSMRNLCLALLFGVLTTSGLNAARFIDKFASPATVKPGETVTFRLDVFRDAGDATAIIVNDVVPAPLIVTQAAQISGSISNLEITFDPSNTNDVTFEGDMDGLGVGFEIVAQVPCFIGCGPIVIENQAVLNNFEASSQLIPVTIDAPKPTVEIVGNQFNGEATICKGKRLSLCAIPTVNGEQDKENPYHYEWTFTPATPGSEPEVFSTNQCIKKRVRHKNAGKYTVTIRDCNDCPDSASVDVNVIECPHLNVNKCAIILPNNQIRYEITVRNTGGATANNVVITDFLPNDSSCFDDVFAPDGGVYDPVTNTVVFPPFNIDPNTTVLKAIFVTLAESCRNSCLNNLVKVKADNHSTRTATHCVCFETLG